MQTPAPTINRAGRQEIEVTPVFFKNAEAKTRLVLNEGGSRSSKTYSLAQMFMGKLFSEPNVVISVCRKTLPALRATAMKDFFNIMRASGQYDVANHNKTENIYRNPANNSEIEFFSVDQAEKIKGRKRDYLWMNEATEFELEDFRQLSLRTGKQIFMDYNPPDEYHWIIEELLDKRKDYTFIHSSYRDNTFLESEIVREIELLQQADENYWRIYGLGLRGVSGVKIYSHWVLVDELPENCEEIIYGIDFGFNKPAAVVRIGIKDGVYYWQELLYESGLTNNALILKLDDFRTQGLITSNMCGYADAAEPARIKEISDGVEINGRQIEGFNVVAADKSVKDGIDFIKAHQFKITKDSVNLHKEAKAYMWKTKDGKILDEPVKANDHCMDAGRYAVYTHHKIQGEGTARVRLI